MPDSLPCAWDHAPERLPDAEGALSAAGHHSDSDTGSDARTNPCAYTGSDAGSYSRTHTRTDASTHTGSDTRPDTGSYHSADAFGSYLCTADCCTVQQTGGYQEPDR